MKKFPKGNKSGASSDQVSIKDTAFSNVSDGSMNYMEKQEKFHKEDSSKLNRNSFKDSRYS